MRRLLVVAAATALVVPAIASAHEGNPNFRSDITAVTPANGSVKLDVLNGDDRLELINQSNQPVLIYGYNDGDPYARILPDGTVQVNADSPATYLNEDRFQEGVKVPAGVDGKGTPRWRLVDKTGRFEWHDHRIHYMTKGVPPTRQGRERQDEGLRLDRPDARRHDGGRGPRRAVLDPQGRRRPAGAVRSPASQHCCWSVARSCSSRGAGAGRALPSGETRAGAGRRAAGARAVGCFCPRAA